MTPEEMRDRRMRVLLELVGVDEAEKLGVSAFSLALDRLEAIDAKHAEEVVSKQTNRIQSMEAALGNIASAAAHNAPLEQIKGLAERSLKAGQ